MIAAPPAPTVAAGSANAAYCPARAPQSLAQPDWPAAQAQLAPGGATGAIVCRYAGLNAHPRLGLTAAAVVRSRATVDQLVWRLDALRPIPNELFSCPAATGEEILAELRYPGGQAVRITVGLSGCDIVTNGAVARTTVGFGRPGSGPPLLKLLTRLLA